MKRSTAKFIIIPILSVLCAFVVLAGLICSVFLVTNAAVMIKGGDIREDFGTEKYDCILVLGAGLRPDRSPSDMLADRLDVAIRLYKSGVSDVIVLSGDFSVERDYDEVSAMELYCLESGVPGEDIRKDIKGYSTYESVYNLKSENKYKKVIVVTQKYHLYRALYIAGEMGFDAVGADAAIRTYRGQVLRDVREVAARTKDFFQVMLVYK